MSRWPQRRIAWRRESHRGASLFYPLVRRDEIGFCPGDALPATPDPAFRSTRNRAGRYCVKKFRGKVHRFGPRDADAQAALAEYLRVKDDLLAGRKLREETDGVTVRYAANHFLTGRSHRVDGGDLDPRSFREYKAVCKMLVQEFGAKRLLVTMAVLVDVALF